MGVRIELSGISTMTFLGVEDGKHERWMEKRMLRVTGLKNKCGCNGNNYYGIIEKETVTNRSE